MPSIAAIVLVGSTYEVGQIYACLLLLLRKLVPPLVDLNLNRVLLYLTTRGKRGFEIRFDNGTRMLVVQEGSSEGLLGRIGVLFLLLALALLALVGVNRLVGRRNDVGYFVDEVSGSVDDSGGGRYRCCDIVLV